jgi:hypothetical protein
LHQAAAADYLLAQRRDKPSPPAALEWRVCGCVVLARCGDDAPRFLRTLGVAIQQYAVVKALSLAVLLVAVQGSTASLRPVLVLTKTSSLVSLVNLPVLFM